MKIRSHSARPALRAAGVAVATSIMLGACANDVVQSSVNPGPAADASSYASLLRVADAMHASGDNGSAVGLYRRANAIMPREPEPLVKLGAALADLHSFNEAATAYRSALEIAPNNTEALRGLGNTLLSLDQPQLARTQFEAALAADPKDPRTHNGLGVVLDLIGDHRAAQSRYREGLALAPDNLTLRNNLGLSLALSGDYRDAITALQAIAFGPDATPRIRQNLALIYGLAGDLDSAARVGRLDLDEAAVRSNIAYYAVLRELADRPRTSALGANPARYEIMGIPKPGVQH